MPDDRDIAAIAGPERPELTTHAIVAVVMAGVLAAVILPDHRIGISLSIVALAGAGAVLVGLGRAPDRKELVFGSLGLALALMPSLRAAEWILSLDILATMGVATVAVTSAESWRSLFAAPFTVIAKARWVPVTLANPVLERFRGRGAAGLGTFVRTTSITVALVVVFGTLFISADAAFANFATDVFNPEVRFDIAFARVVTFALMTLFAGALILTRRAAATSAGSTVTEARHEIRARKISEWALPIAVLDVLFAAFVAIQLTVLFGGSHHVELTPGLTYAEYARQGFFQLLTVAALVLVVIAGTVFFARPDDRRTRRIAQIVLGALCVLTLVVLASAWYRLGVYEDAYGLTRLRISVYASIVWLGVIFGLLLAAGVVWKSAWLPRVVVGITAAGLLAFTLVNPDALIAHRNVERFEATGLIDLGYLATLSEDAVPALTELPVGERDCVLAQIAGRNGASEDLSWTEWSYSRSTARSTLERLSVPATPPAFCETSY